MRRVFLLITILATTLGAQAGEIRSGEDVLRAMYERYKSSWYETLTFTQKSTTYKEDGTSSAETWYEAASLPGKLRIDIGDPSKNNGYLLVDGKVTIFKDGKNVGNRESQNMLLVLGFDLYRQAPEATIKVLKGEGYDLSKLHEETWEGKPTYVVGADQGDLKSKQFWVVKDTLLFARDIEASPSDTSKVDDIRFTHYQPLAGAWVAAGVEVYANGRKVFSEDYSNIRANVKLDPLVFDPEEFSTTHWEKP